MCNIGIIDGHNIRAIYGYASSFFSVFLAYFAFVAVAYYACYIPWKLYWTKKRINDRRLMVLAEERRRRWNLEKTPSRINIARFVQNAPQLQPGAVPEELLEQLRMLYSLQQAWLRTPEHLHHRRY